jgi:uncharacterized protein YndB with AHSA1/START domain
MSDPVFTISRSYDAPLSLIWQLFSEEKHLAKWWGPKGFDWVKGTMDFRPGGLFHYCMRGPNGMEMWGRFAYREIEPLKKVVYTSSFSDPQGGVARAPFAAGFPLEILNTMRFSEAAGKTTLDLAGSPVDASDEERAFFRSMFPSMNQGFTGTFNQLEDYLKEVKA